MHVDSDDTLTDPGKLYYKIKLIKRNEKAIGLI